MPSCPSGSFCIIFVIMAESKHEGLPRIAEKRLKTEGRSASFRSNQHNLRKFTFNLKTQQASEYLKSWLNREDESRKMQKILRENLQQKLPFPRPAAKSVNRTTIALKHQPQLQPPDQEYPQTLGHGNTSVVLGKQKPIISLERAQLFYEVQLRGREPEWEKLREFRQLLQVGNPLFQKLSIVISDSLLRVGSIAAYQAGEVIYKEGFPVRSLGVLLWGEAVLRCRRSRAKYSCLAGSTIGEQLIFEDVDYASRKYSSVEKGELCSRERCKAASSCGVLFVGEKELGYMLEDLVRGGFREETARFKSILQRIYLKKREFRSAMF